MSDDFFAELEAEIKQHTQKAQMRKDAAKLKKTAMNRAVAEVERLTALRQYRELQAILDVEVWRPVSLVAFFTEQQCDGCGSVHRVFLQYMEQQVLRQRPETKRWVRVGIPESHLPKEVLVHSHKTHICADCADDHGFSFAESATLHLPNPVAVSTTYEQGDINAQAEIDRPTASDGAATSNFTLQ